jgi:hypothetical protein
VARNLSVPIIHYIFQPNWLPSGDAKNIQNTWEVNWNITYRAYGMFGYVNITGMFIHKERDKIQSKVASLTSWIHTTYSERRDWMGWVAIVMAWPPFHQRKKNGVGTWVGTTASPNALDNKQISWSWEIEPLLLGGPTHGLLAVATKLSGHIKKRGRGGGARNLNRGRKNNVLHFTADASAGSSWYYATV